MAKTETVTLTRLEAGAIWEAMCNLADDLDNTGMSPAQKDAFRRAQEKIRVTFNDRRKDT